MAGITLPLIVINMVLSCKYVYFYNLTVYEWYVNGVWMASPSKMVP